jgi:hypothetical protein
MPLETDGLTQNAVLWRANGVDSFGEHRVEAPVNIPVRWIKGKRENVDTSQTSEVVTDKVIVDRVIPLGSIMWLGKLEEFPYPLEDIRSVVDFRETPDIKNREMRRVVMLSNFHGSPPPAT